MRPGIIMLEEGDINHLIVAVNQYVSTGDHIGEGIAAETADRKRYLLYIPVGKYSPLDQEDFKRLEARIAELPLDLLLLPEPTPHPQFDFYILSLRQEDADTLIDLLLERPGPLGWGSPKPLVEEFIRRGRPGPA